MFNKKEIQRIWSKFGFIENTIKENNKFFQRNFDKLQNKIGKDLSELIACYSKKLDELKQYVECDTCGHLVNKEKAKVEWSLEDKNYDKTAITYFTIDFALGHREIPSEKKAVKTYKCIHCQPKKSNKK